jgi:uncharacterized protein (TIGR02996 family)
MAKAKAKAKKATTTASPNLDPKLALRAARDALGGGDFAEASRLLVDVWASLPSPRIAALALRASKRLPVRALPSAVAAREAAWLELASTHDRAALPTLLAIDWPVHPRGAKARLAELVEFPPDPRIAESLLSLWHAERFRSNASAAFWKSAFRALGAWGDPRPSELPKHDALAYVLDTLDRVVAPALDRGVAAELAALEAALDGAEPAPASHDALFAAVYAEPDADAPRAVLGDALLADGDPRGEFIQLQLAATTSAKQQTRIRALLREHAAEWTGGLADTRSCEFRRGFVNAVAIDALPERAGPEWRTVEQLAFIADPPTADELAHAIASPSFVGVRRLLGIELASLATVAPPRVLERVVARAPLAPLPSSLRIRELAIVRAYNQASPSLADTFAWLAALPNVATLVALELDHDERSLAGAAAWLRERAPATLERVTVGTSQFGPSAWRVELSRARGGTVALAATWHGRLYGERSAEGLDDAIAAIPRGSIASITASSAVKLEPELRASLERDLAIGAGAHGLAAPTIT